METKIRLSEKVGELLRTSKIARILEIILIFFIALIIINAFISSSKEDLIYNQMVLWIANIIMIVLIWLGLYLRGEKIDHFGLFTNKVSMKQAFIIFLKSLLVCGLAVVGFIFGSMIMINLFEQPDQLNLNAYDYFKDNLGMFLLSLGGVFISSSFGEEFIYRGFLINRVAEIFPGMKSGKWIAVLVSAVVFGLAHYNWGAMGVVQTTFMGLALAICYLKMKNLWIMILAHAYMDTLLFVQMYLAANG